MTKTSFAWFMAFAGLVSFSASCGSEAGSCSPAGFTTCSKNTLITCNEEAPGSVQGVTEERRCTAEGLVCTGTQVSACAKPVLGAPCFERNWDSCGDDNQLLKCVWVSEQPHPQYSGDIGVWRALADCSAMGQTCKVDGGKRGVCAAN